MAVCLIDRSSSLLVLLSLEVSSHIEKIKVGCREIPRLVEQRRQILLGISKESRCTP